MWIIAIIIKKHGLHNLTEGLYLLDKFRLTINKNRYYLNNKNIPSLFEIVKVLSINSIYNPSNPHEINYRLYTSNTRNKLKTINKNK